MQNQISYYKQKLEPIYTILSLMNFINIGKIVDFDEAKNIVSVDLVFERKKEGETKYEKVPTLKEVPLFILQGGTSFIKPPIKIGDECIVLFNDRDIDNWWANVSNVPNSLRMHSLSDAIAIIGITSLKRVLDIKAKLFEIIIGEDDPFNLRLRGKERDDPDHVNMLLTKDGYKLNIKEKTLNVSFSKEKGYKLDFEDGTLVIYVDKENGVEIKDKKGSIVMKEGRYGIKNHAGDDLIKVLEDTIKQLQTALQEASKMKYDKPIQLIVPIQGVPTSVPFYDTDFLTKPVDNALNVGSEANKLTTLINKIKEFEK